MFQYLFYIRNTNIVKYIQISIFLEQITIKISKWKIIIDQFGN